MNKSHEQKFPIRLVAPLSGALCSVVAFLAMFSFAHAARASAPGQSSSPWANIPESFATGQGTGLVLGFDEGTNVWFAHALWANSPAEQAGIPVGARVLSIGGIALPVGAIANQPSALTEIKSCLGAAASVGSIAVGWQDSGGTLHNNQIRFEPMPDLYLRATANGGAEPQQCFTCSGCVSNSLVRATCLLTSGPGGLFCKDVPCLVCATSEICIPIGTSDPPLSGVVSRMTHGSITNPPYFDVTLPLTGTRGVECRSSTSLGAGNYTMIFTFVNTVASCGVASTTEGTATVTPGPAASPALNVNQCMVSLTGVPNASYVTVTLTDAADSAGNAGNVSSTMGVLIGDVNANGVVTNADVSLVKAQIAAGGNIDPAGSNFRDDVNANGVITNADVSLTKAQVAAGAQLPTPP